MIEAFAVSRFQPGSAKKLTLVADLIRGKDVPTALRTLAFLVKPSKAPVMKTLRSAVADVQKAGCTVERVQIESDSPLLAKTNTQ